MPRVAGGLRVAHGCRGLRWRDGSGNEGAGSETAVRGANCDGGQRRRSNAEGEEFVPEMAVVRVGGRHHRVSWGINGGERCDYGMRTVPVSIPSWICWMHTSRVCPDLAIHVWTNDSSSVG